MFDECSGAQSLNASRDHSAVCSQMSIGVVEVELPGTPISTVSAGDGSPRESVDRDRDSSASFNSSSSVRQLLSTPSNVQLEEAHGADFV